MIFLYWKKLDDLIEDGDIKRKELAIQIGVEPKQIRRWINGEAEAGVWKIKKICEIYNVSADWLLDVN